MCLIEDRYRPKIYLLFLTKEVYFWGKINSGDIACWQFWRHFMLTVPLVWWHWSNLSHRSLKKHGESSKISLTYCTSTRVSDIHDVLCLNNWQQELYSRPEVDPAFMRFRATASNGKTQTHTGRLVEYAALSSSSLRFRSTRRAWMQAFSLPQ